MAKKDNVIKMDELEKEAATEEEIKVDEVETEEAEEIFDEEDDGVNVEVVHKGLWNKIKHSKFGQFVNTHRAAIAGIGGAALGIGAMYYLNKATREQDALMLVDTEVNDILEIEENDDNIVAESDYLEISEAPEVEAEVAETTETVEPPIEEQAVESEVSEKAHKKANKKTE